MKEVKAYIKPNMIDYVIDSLESLDDAPGITLSDIRGWGHPKEGPTKLVEMVKLETVVPTERVEEVTSVIIDEGQTGSYGDGKIFVSNVERAIRIRTGETDYDVVR